MKKLATLLTALVLVGNAAFAQVGTVIAEQKISQTQGGFNGTLVNDLDFGTSISNIGDLNNDGVIDLAVGAPYGDDGGTNRGEVWILFMNANGTVSSEQKISQTQGGFGGTIGNADSFGRSVSLIGDLNNDGVNDIVVGARRSDDGGTYRGSAWILFLNTNGTVSSETKISSTTGGFTGPLSDGDEFGMTVAGIGDLDGDGNEDIAVGASQDDDAGTNTGAVWILFLDTDGTVLNEQKITEGVGGFTGDLDDNERAGIGLYNAGDINRDGVIDIIMGAAWDDDSGQDRGAFYVLFMNSNGTVSSHQKISDTQGGFSGLLDDGDFFGHTPAAIGDVNGDCKTDLAVGVIGDDDGGTDRGAVWILFLDTNGTVLGEQKISDTQGGLNGILDNDDKMGAGVDGLGDLDGDGFLDIAVGAVWDDDGGTNRGAVYILNLDGMLSNLIGAVSNNPDNGSCDGDATVTPSGGTAPYTYLWDDPNTQTTQTASGLCVGTYCVTLTDANGCTWDTCGIDIMVGIDDLTISKRITIYPNPSEGKFTVQGATGEIQVYDLFGRLVLSSIKPEIDMSNYPAGLYIWRVGFARGKLVKE